MRVFSDQRRISDGADYRSRIPSLRRDEGTQKFLDCLSDAQHLLEADKVSLNHSPVLDQTCRALSAIWVFVSPAAADLQAMKAAQQRVAELDD